MRTVESDDYQNYLEITEYWTPSRMAEAAPVGEIGQPPAVQSEALGAFVTNLVVDSTDFFHRRTGKLFMTFKSFPYYGSAFAIHKTGIGTAAHCLYDRNLGAWAEKVMFVPAYANKLEPFGRWPVIVNQAGVSPKWVNEGVHAWDYGFCKTNLGGKGGFQILGEVIGWYGMAVDRSTVKQWNTLGYPCEPIPGYNFDGERMWSSVGSYYSTLEFSTIGKEGNLTRGSSGGPWLIGAADVNGIQSYSNGSLPNVNFSPYFDGSVLELYSKIFSSTAFPDSTADLHINASQE